MNTVNSDILLEIQLRTPITRAINEDNIYPSILNRICPNSPYIAECAPNIQSSLELAPTLVTSSISLEELTIFSSRPLTQQHHAKLKKF